MRFLKYLITKPYKPIFYPYNFVTISNMTVKQGQKLSIRTQVKVLIRSENLKVGKPLNHSIKRSSMTFSYTLTEEKFVFS